MMVRLGEMVGSLMQSRVDHYLGENMESYALDANVVLASIGVTKAYTHESGEDILSKFDGQKKTIYRSTISEVAYVVKNRNPDEPFENLFPDFSERFRRAFDNESTRIVMNTDPYELVMNEVEKLDKKAARSIDGMRQMLGDYDCLLAAQSFIEGNTVYSYDKSLIALCEFVGVSNKDGRSPPSSFAGFWEPSGGVGYGNFVIKSGRKQGSSTAR